MRVAPDARLSVTWLIMWIEFADRYVPAGNWTIPSPVALAASIASLIADVSLVVPSPFAPKSRTLNVVAADASGTTASASNAVTDRLGRRGYLTVPSLVRVRVSPESRQRNANAFASGRHPAGERQYIGCIGENRVDRCRRARPQAGQAALLNRATAGVSRRHRFIRNVRFIGPPCQRTAVRPHHLDCAWLRTAASR